MKFALSAGNEHEALPGRELLASSDQLKRTLYLLMDCAYESDQTRLFALDLGYEPVVPPKANRCKP